MRVAIIARATLFSVPGGDTIQAIETSRQLNVLGVSSVIKLTNEHIGYHEFDLLHFFNLIRPADILFHSNKASKPFVVSTILVDYSEYDKEHRKGAGALFNYLPANAIEYVKTMARWLSGKDHLSTISYIWKGQKRSIIEIIKKASLILPNSESEYTRIKGSYLPSPGYKIIPNGVDCELFKPDEQILKDDKLVICVARIEGVKNHINLIRALNNTPYTLLLIGAGSPNQAAYYQECKSLAAANVHFIDHLPQKELLTYYQRAKVHVLPSWFETTGLSSLEAAVMHCNVVITDRGDTREYFGDDAFYCDPANPASIRAAVEKASLAGSNKNLHQRILKNYTWKQAAIHTYKAYQLAVA